MAKKQKGGEESYLNNFVDEVMNSFNMKGGGKQKGGVVELSPMLVSLMTLGMRVAADPKLSAILKKHNKISGGNGELVAKAAIDQLLTSTKGSFKGGNIEKSDMFSNAVLPVAKGGKNRRKVGGGEAEDLIIPPADEVQEDFSDFAEIINGGAKRSKATKAAMTKTKATKAIAKVTKAKKGKKQRGGENSDDEYTMLQEFEKSGDIDQIEEFSNLMNGGRKGRRMKGGSDEDVDLMFDQPPADDVSLEQIEEFTNFMNGGKKPKQTKQTKKTSKKMKGGSDEDVDLMFDQPPADDVSLEQIEEFTNFMNGGKKPKQTKKTSKKMKGGSDEDVDLMIDQPPADDVSLEQIEEFTNFMNGGKKPRNYRKSKK